MVNSEELIGTTEYLTLYTRCRDVVITAFDFRKIRFMAELLQRKDCCSREVCKGEFVPVHAMKTRGAVVVQFHSFLTSTLGRLIGQLHVPAALSPVLNEYWTFWVRDLFWTFWITEKSLEICALLGYYASLSGSFVPTFRDNLSASS
jgi:hypothetical protein